MPSPPKSLLLFNVLFCTFYFFPVYSISSLVFQQLVEEIFCPFVLYLHFLFQHFTIFIKMCTLVLNWNPFIYSIIIKFLVFFSFILCIVHNYLSVKLSLLFLVTRLASLLSIIYFLTLLIVFLWIILIISSFLISTSLHSSFLSFLTYPIVSPSVLLMDFTIIFHLT